MPRSLAHRSIPETPPIRAVNSGYSHFQILDMINRRADVGQLGLKSDYGLRAVLCRETEVHGLQRRSD